MSDKKRDEDVFDRVRREVREKQEKETARREEFEKLTRHQKEGPEGAQRLGGNDR